MRFEQKVAPRDGKTRKTKAQFTAAPPQVCWFISGRCHGVLSKSWAVLVPVMLRVHCFLLAVVSANNSCQPDREQEDAACLLQSAVQQDLATNKTDGIFTAAAIAAMVAKAVKAAKVVKVTGSVHASHSLSWIMATKTDPKFLGWERTKNASKWFHEALLPGQDKDGLDFQRNVGIFTIGSPGPFRPAPRNLQSADGCWKGIRLAAEEARAFGLKVPGMGMLPYRSRDPVPAVAGPLQYEHPPMDVMLLNTGNGDIELSEMQHCSHWDWRSTVPAYAGIAGAHLHMTSHYDRALQNLKHWAWDSQSCVDGWKRPSNCATSCTDGWTGDYCYTAANNRRRWRGRSSKCTKCRDAPVGLNTVNRWQTLGKITIDISYLDASNSHDVQKAKHQVPYGYHVEGYAHVTSDKTGIAGQSSWLLKHSEGNCVVTFAGTDSWEDWLQDAQVNPAAFCGFLDEKDEKSLQNGHSFTFWGFKYHLLRMVKSWQFQNWIRPKLKHCTSVDAAGHSLGGAMAILFSTCIHNAPKRGEAGYEDYALMGFA